LTGLRIAEPARTIEVVCFLRYCLLTQTDHLLLMVRRRVADLWRIAAAGVDAKLADWARLYQELLGELGSLASDAALSSHALREQLITLLQAQRARRPRSRAEIVRDRLIEGIRPVRALLKALVALPWKARAAHPLLEVMHLLRGLYETCTAREYPQDNSYGVRVLPALYECDHGKTQATRSQSNLHRVYGERFAGQLTSANAVETLRMASENNLLKVTLSFPKSF
jgi:hypothetical protein